MTKTILQSSFLNALDGKNATVPVWFMRQAGRYLPEYQAIRRTMPLDEMFQNPHVVADVTCLPVDVLEVDAAILFADILTLPGQIGFDIHFEKNVGPVIDNPIVHAEDVGRMGEFGGLDYLAQAIKNIHQRLPSHVPLIGFAGAPFTVLSYLVEGGTAKDFQKTLSLMRDQPQAYHKAMSKLTQNTILYLNMQKDAGVQSFQLFDTWAGILSLTEYHRCVTPYIDEIVDAVDLPSIYFIKDSNHILDEVMRLKADFISLCPAVDLNSDALAQPDKGIQGNLDPQFLYTDNESLCNEVDRILETARKLFPKYIFNLGHGVRPDVDVEKLKFIVQKVHAFPWRTHE